VNPEANMNAPHYRDLAEDADHPLMLSQADLEAALARSAAEIADGRSIPLEPVLERLRATADRIRRGRADAEQVSTPKA